MSVTTADAKRRERVRLAEDAEQWHALEASIAARIIVRRGITLRGRSDLHGDFPISGDDLALAKAGVIA